MGNVTNVPGNQPIRCKIEQQVACPALLANAGCGYSLVRYSESFGDVRSVAVVTPENRDAGRYKT